MPNCYEGRPESLPSRPKVGSHGKTAMKEDQKAPQPGSEGGSQGRTVIKKDKTALVPPEKMFFILFGYF